MDVWEYFLQKESEFRELSLVPDRDFDDLFAEEAGSRGKRGRIFGNLWLTAEDQAVSAFLQVSEKVVVRRGRPHREEYAYFLVIDGVEFWGYERDLSHNPPVHRHAQGHRRATAKPVAFKQVAEWAWDEVSRLAYIESTE